MTHLFAKRRDTFLWVLGIFALVLFTYWWSLGNQFVNWDDGLLITQNAIVRGLTWEHIQAAFTRFDPELYIPLTFLSFQVNYALGGMQPFGFHLLNILLHAANALLVSFVVFAIDKRKVTAIVAALLFAVHPINTETVAWASGRKDLLAALFFLLSIIAYFRREESPKPWLWFSLSLGAFVLGLLSKVVIVTLPVALLLIDWYRGKPIWNKREGTTLLPFLLLSILFAIIASIGKVTSGGFFLEKFAMGSLSVMLHLQHLVWPVGFSVLYPYTSNISFFTADIFGSLLLNIALLAGSWSVRKWTRLPLFAYLWFVLMLFPSMTNIAKGYNELLDVYITSDRYAYLPVISVFFAIGFGMSFLQTLSKSIRTTANVVLLIILSIFTFLTISLSKTWFNTVTLFSQVLAHHPNAYIAYTNIGTDYYQRGQTDRALQYYEAALNIRPDSTTLYNMGVMLMQAKRRPEAMQKFQEAAESSLLDPNPRIAIGTMLIEDKKWNEAEVFLRQALEDAKASTHLYGLLGFVLEERGKKAEAIAMYQKALEIDPTNRDAIDGLRALGVPLP